MLPAQIIHPYQDNELVSEIKTPCYDLREMLAEKLRAISGQRRFSIGRDIYDEFQLVVRGGISPVT